MLSAGTEWQACRINGVQVVAGSNPATPISEANLCQNGMEKIRDDHLNQIFVVTSLESLVKGYVLNCRCEGKSPRTMEYYEQHLKRFLWYVSSEPVRWGGPCQLARRPVGQTTVAHYYHCLYIFF